MAWQAKGDNIMKHSIFMDKINYCMGKIIFALANPFSHGQNNVCMGNFIIALANLLLHRQIYYCMSKSIIALANLFSMGNLFCMGKIILRMQ